MRLLSLRDGKAAAVILAQVYFTCMTHDPEPMRASTRQVPAEEQECIEVARIATERYQQQCIKEGGSADSVSNRCSRNGLVPLSAIKGLLSLEIGASS